MADSVSPPDVWRIQFEACNEILRGVGMEAYQLSMVEEEPVKATVELLIKREKWFDEVR